MKLLTKEEENAHYSSVVKGGSVGTICGLAAGAAGVMLASRRYHTIRNLTLPMKAFLVTSSGTFVGIIAADHASRSFEAERNQQMQWYENREQRLRSEELSQLTMVDRALLWARREKYKIVGVTWVASMIGSFALVGRNPYLSGQQKIVQARVYAQGLTLAVLVASAGFEISDQRRGKGLLEASKEQKKKQAAVEKVQQEESAESGDLWKDMVAAEEERLKKKHVSLYEKHGHHDNDHADTKESTPDSAPAPAKEEAQSPAPATEEKKEN
ncbi:Replication factor C, subunit RFC4 [Aspergillus melleus]|uniref:Replication factor C, subunit RFC4 n=1 Tax=Aspergillus melleus TaxID=138277 RepID=A0ACC3AT77_9EURO|nr:Replication factor C, subunit RFC4 [Aspergillus melleus]